MKKHNLICLFLGLILAFLIYTPMTFAAPWYQENFDGLPNGDLIGKGGWTGFHGFLVVQDKVAHGETGKSIKTVPDGEADLKLPGDHAGVQYISFYIRKRGLDPFVAFYVGDSPDGKWNQQGIAVQLKFGNGGVVEANDEDIGVAYVSERWHHVRIVMDFDNEDCQVYFDDKLAADRLAFKGIAKKLNWIRIQASETHPLAFFDSFEIGEVGGEAVMPINKLVTIWSSIKSNG